MDNTLNYTYTPLSEPKPYCCPVCFGKGTVPAGFYDTGINVTIIYPENCRSCSGSGVLWSHTPMGILTASNKETH
jgi:hypothetical protein